MLEIDRIDIAYGTQRVVHDVSLRLAKGQVGCLLGPSGSGKTSVLRAIAGFEPLVGGEIRLNGEVLSRQGWMTAPEHRQIGMVFQDFALLPHLSVAENVAFGLHRLAPSARAARVNEMLAFVQLDAARKRFPHELSGGMQQRVALARALAPIPALLLMDEPFANLDPNLREQLSGELRELLERAKITALIVTHTQNEAFALGDVLGVMQAGRLRQWDTPYAVYHEPADADVASFIGESVWLRGVASDGEVRSVLGLLRSTRAVADGPVKVLLRPDDVVHDDASPTTARVVRRAFRGAEFLYTLALESGEQVLSLVPSHHRHAIGEAIGVRLDVEHVVCFASPD